MAIVLTEHEVQSRLQERLKLKKFLLSQLETLAYQVSNISIVFCSDTFLLDLNQQYLNHDTYTDIITFDLSENSDEINTEIYISIDRVKENAEKYNVSYASELHRVIFHGVLHTIGYQDKEPKEQNKMREAEDKWLEMYKNYKIPE